MNTNERNNKIAAEAADNSRNDSYWLGELLAVIHGDGGHYQSEHGTEKATEDAIIKINLALMERIEKPCEPEFRKSEP